MMLYKYVLRQELSRLKAIGNVREASALRALQSLHQRKYLQAYGIQEVIPKAHWRLHLPEQLEHMGRYHDLQAMEKKHQCYKDVASERFDTLTRQTGFSKAVLLRTLAQTQFQVRQLVAKETTGLLPPVSSYVDASFVGKRSKGLKFEGRSYYVSDVVTSPVPGIVADCRQVENGDYYIFVQPYDRAPGFASTLKGEMWTKNAAAKPVPLRFRSGQPVLCASFWSFEDNGLLVLP